MKKYVKLKDQTRVEYFPNPFKVIVSNPTDEMKAKLAELFDWKELVETPTPDFDEETQTVSSTYEEKNGKVIQVWNVIDLPEDEIEE